MSLWVVCLSLKCRQIDDDHYEQSVDVKVAIMGTFGSSCCSVAVVVVAAAATAAVVATC